jgi:hypothetical protein
MSLSFRLWMPLLNFFAFFATLRAILGGVARKDAKNQPFKRAPPGITIQNSSYPACWVDGMLEFKPPRKVSDSFLSQRTPLPDQVLGPLRARRDVVRDHESDARFVEPSSEGSQWLSCRHTLSNMAVADVRRDRSFNGPRGQHSHGGMIPDCCCWPITQETAPPDFGSWRTCTIRVTQECLWPPMPLIEFRLRRH